MSKKMMKCPTWSGLRQIVMLGREREFIHRYPEKLHRAVSLALSVAHWSPESREHCSDAGVFRGNPFPHHGCALCSTYSAEACDGCPLKEADEWCEDANQDSLWFKVHMTINHGLIHSSGGFHKAADALYWKLMELYRIEWEKL